MYFHTKRFLMKIAQIVLLSCMIAIGVAGQEKKVLLPNGWSLTPYGKSVKLADLPLNMAFSPDGKWIAVTNNGVGKQYIQLLDAHSLKMESSVEIAKSWLGLKFSADGRFLFASCGNDNRIMKYNVNGGKLQMANRIVLGRKWPNKISPAGIEVDDKEQKLYTVTKENNALYIVDLHTNQVADKVGLGAEAYTCLLSRDHALLYISLWGSDKVVVFDTRKSLLVDSITVRRNPNDMCLSKDGKYLYVANSIDNSVSVIETGSRKVIETLNAALFPDAACGSTTNSVCLSEDNKTLYAANADNNCLAVFDVSTPGSSHSRGFIPTGWYPTCVRARGRQVYVLNGKGNSSLPNPRGPQPVRKEGQAKYMQGNRGNEQYIGSLLLGTMTSFQEPGTKELVKLSEQVYRNTPYSKDHEKRAAGELGNPVPRKVGDPSPIKHVFYIIKENRTYDQVLSDMPAGNGDTSLLLFGQKITPNEHALAGQFVLLDNFYVDGEVSADGHNWSTAAYATDFVEKQWPTNYGGRGGSYIGAANRPASIPRDGFIWDDAQRSGVSYRDYGEFMDDDGKSYLPELTRHMCHNFPGWDLGIRDAAREKIWERDFDSLVAIHALPALNIVYFPCDHTAGLGKKTRTPFAFVADNDLAVGLFVEHLSRSPVWNNSVVFILEDDAQNGPDHVDAHRSTAFVAGPYVKHGYVDHSMYSTSGMIRTMELILGMPPMSQYDAAALPMYHAFSREADTRPYQHREANIDMEALNGAAGPLSDKSEGFDFSAPDRVPDTALNALLWAAIKGNVPYPGPKRAAFVAVREDDDAE